MSAPGSNSTIRAEIANGIATAGNESGRGSVPVLNLCRELIVAGADPNSTLEVYRGAVLALRVTTIGQGAALTIREDDGLRLTRWRPYPDAPQMVPQHRTVTPGIAQKDFAGIPTGAKPRQRIGAVTVRCTEAA